MNIEFNEFDCDKWLDFFQNILKDCKSNKTKKKSINIIQNYIYLFLYLNSIKYKIFTFKYMHLWNTIYVKKKQHMDELKVMIKNDNFDDNEKIYIKLLYDTLDKYDEKFGTNLYIMMNRIFCKDICCEILRFI